MTSVKCLCMCVRECVFHPTLCRFHVRLEFVKLNRKCACVMLSLSTSSAFVGLSADLLHPSCDDIVERETAKRQP